MKYYIGVCLLIRLVSSASLFDDKEEQWITFKTAFDKIYRDYEEDRDKMMVYFRNKDFIFYYNQNYINELNSQSLKMNQFGDLSAKEFRKRYNGFNKQHLIFQSYGQSFVVPLNVTVPDSIDWREKISFSEIEDQGNYCKADWAFSIYYEPNCLSGRPDRSVLIVGYDRSPNGEDYWIIKNSLGITCGDKGYMKLSRNKSNHCGIATAASFPKLSVT